MLGFERSRGLRGTVLQMLLSHFQPQPSEAQPLPQRLGVAHGVQPYAKYMARNKVVFVSSGRNRDVLCGTQENPSGAWKATRGRSSHQPTAYLPGPLRAALLVPCCQVVSPRMSRLPAATGFSSGALSLLLAQPVQLLGGQRSLPLPCLG